MLVESVMLCSFFPLRYQSAVLLLLVLIALTQAHGLLAKSYLLPRIKRGSLLCYCRPIVGVVCIEVLTATCVVCYILRHYCILNLQSHP